MADEPNNTEGTSGSTPGQGYDGGSVPPLGGGAEGADPSAAPTDASSGFGGSTSPYETSSPYAPTNDYNSSSSPYDGGSSDYSSPSPYSGSDSYGLSSGSGTPSSDGSGTDSVDGLYESNDQVTNLSDPTPAPSVSFGKDVQAHDGATSGGSAYGSSTDPYGTTDASASQAQPSPYGQAPQSAASYGQQPEPQPTPGGPQYGASPAYGGAPSYGGTPPYGGGVNPYDGTGYPTSQNKFNIFGLIAVIAGGLGLLLGLIPFVGVAATFLGFAGLILGILGLVLKNFNAKKGLAIAGTIVSVVALIIGIANPFVWAGIITSNAVSDYNTVDKQVEVVITVTADSPVDIDYNISNGISSSTDSVDKSEALFDQTSPWSTTMTIGLNTTSYDGSSISVTADPDEYDDGVSCEITVDGIVVDQDTSTGYASCSVYGVNSYLT